jgi:hypothetical protein
VPARKIEQVLKEHTPGLLAVPGVVGTAEGLCGDRPCIIVYVKKKTPEIAKRIPRSFDGYPVTIDETGVIRALPEKK